jgi:hypothetical protein
MSSRPNVVTARCTIAAVQFLTVEADPVGHADEADVAARTGGTQSLLHGLRRADAFQDGVGADAAGQLPDASYAFVAAFDHDVSGAEVGRELLAGLVAAHGDDALGAQFPGRDHGAPADSAVTDDDGGATRLHLGGDGGVPAGAHDVRAGQEAGHMFVARHLGSGDQGAVGQRHPDEFGLAAADELAVQAAGLVTVAAVRTGVVAGEEGADDELAGWMIFGSARSSMRTSPGAWMTAPRMMISSIRAGRWTRPRGWVPRVSGGCWHVEPDVTGEHPGRPLAGRRLLQQLHQVCVLSHCAVVGAAAA